MSAAPLSPSSHPRRSFLKKAAAGATIASIAPHAASLACSANSEIRIAFIGCGGRGGELMGAFEQVSAVRVTGLCDPDPSRLGKAQQRFPEAKSYADMRNLLRDPNIDAVVVATCNHWHCLAAIWAMQAGKDVYVEKPLSHSQWEGEQTVAAARKYQRICQVGTQQRSDPMQSEIRQFLHEQKAIGDIQYVRVNRYGVRGSIGKRSEPLVIDKDLDYDAWLGPAADLPIFRNQLHYDWHWDWNTGSGEMGNWGIHVLDDVRNVALQDSVGIPKRILVGGGRLTWNDAGQTPNVHTVAFDTGSIPVVMGLSNLTAGPDQNASPKVPGPGSGYIVYGQGGRLEGRRGGAKAFDKDGQLIREFHGDSGAGHSANFIDAVRKRDPSLLNADVQVGHDSTGWCNYANIGFRVGETARVPNAMQLGEQILGWPEFIQEMHEHLLQHQVSMSDPDLRMSEWMELDSTTGRFVGAAADRSNQYLRREYRAQYSVPTIDA